MGGNVVALQKLIRQQRLAACVAIVVFIVRRLWGRWFKRPRGVVIPRGQWLWGTMPEFFDIARAVVKNGHLELLCGFHAQFGRTFATRPPFQPWWLMTTCPRNVERISSTNFPNYPKGKWASTKLSDLFGRGILNVDGPEWYHQRKTASQMFTTVFFRDHVWSVVRRNSRKLRNMFLDADSNQPLDISKYMNRYTLDTIGEIGFGTCIGSLDDPTVPFLESFDSAQRIAFMRFFTPHWRLLRWCGIGSERDTAKHFGHLDLHTRAVVQELRNSIAREDDSAKSSGISWADIEARKSLVGIFLVDAKKHGKDLSEDYLRDLVLNFIVAGRDTTSHALSWTVYCLCTHPDVVEKARTEIFNVCGEKGPAYEDLGRLTYLEAVLNETLRLYPPVPLEARMAEYDDTWPDGTFVPQGAFVMFNIYAMGRDPSIWGEDAAEFRPERWLDMQETPSSFIFPVFHAGPRECPGKRLAKLEMKTCLAMLLSRVTFELAVPADEITQDGNMTIGIASLPCYVRQHPEHGSTESSMTAVPSQSESDLSEQTDGQSTDAPSERDELSLEFLHGGSTQETASERRRRRRSGRTRQREKLRRRMHTPSPEREE